MLLRLLIFVAAIFIIFKLLSGDKKKKQVNAKKAEAKMAAAGQMVKDPMCGCYVTKDSDIRVRDGEKVYLFCSYDCRDRFLKQLEQDRKHLDS